MVSAYLRSLRTRGWLAAAAVLLLVHAPADARTACPAHFASRVEPKLLDARLARGARPLCFSAFAVLHSGIIRTPVYSAERLTRASVLAAQALDTRDNRFHAETRLLSAERAELTDYAGSGYDRGHMAPSGNMGQPIDDYESFSLANIVPQAGLLNRNSWAALEGYVRDLASKLGEAYVVSGPLYEGKRLRRLNGRVLVPTSVWKAVYVPGEGAGAWIATNKDRPRWRVVSIRTLAARTGTDPFPSLDAAVKRKTPKFPNFGGRTSRPRRR